MKVKLAVGGVMWRHVVRKVYGTEHIEGIGTFRTTSFRDLRILSRPCI